MSNLRALLQDIADKQGLTPQAVVDAARPKRSPLHSRFEWDDSIAAEQYRLGQAGDLIRSVKIRHVLASGQRANIRAFNAVRTAEVPTVYEPTEEIIADPLKRKMLLQAFERDWRTFKARYEALEEFAAIVLADLTEGAA